MYQRQKLRKEGKLKESNYKNGNKPEKGTRGTDKSTWKEQDRKRRLENKGYYQDANDRWRRPNGQYASNREVGISKPKPQKAVEGGSKTGPKPFGTGPHNEKIGEIASQVKDGKVIAGGQVLPEKAIPTSGGFKDSRRPDILVEKPDGSIYGINVGKTTTSGAPIKRKVEAIYDLEDAGIPMHFVPYFK